MTYPNYVFSELPEEREERETQSVDQITDPNDPRLVELWSKVHSLADSAGYCGVYDELVERLGLDLSRRTAKAQEYSTVEFTKAVIVNGETYNARYQVGARNLPENPTKNEVWAGIVLDSYATVPDSEYYEDRLARVRNSVAYQLRADLMDKVGLDEFRLEL